MYRMYNIKIRKIIVLFLVITLAHYLVQVFAINVSAKHPTSGKTSGIPIMPVLIP